MNHEIKAQWLAALRSGEYQQGQGALRSEDDKFCCLGVLCDLAVKAGVAEWKDNFGERVYYVGNRHATLPREVKAWAGLADRFGGYGGEMGDYLTDDNDLRGHDFNRIADTIERRF